MFQKAEVIFVDDVAFKWAVIIDGEFHLCFDLMDATQLLLTYTEKDVD